MAGNTGEFVDARVKVDGGDVFVRRWHNERGQGRAPIVLLHDSLGCVELWRDFPAALAGSTGRDVLAYDRPGFGRSDPRKGLPSPDFVAEEAAVFSAIRRAIGLSRFALFGHSVGGAMAVAIAAGLGDVCEAVVTESAQAFVEERTLAGIRAAKAGFAGPGRLDKLVKWHGDKALWVLDAWTEVWLSPGFASWNLDPWLERLACPLLAIHGDRDEYGSVAFPERIARLARGPSELAILADCGHVPHRERQDEVLRLVARFLQATGDA